MQHLLTGAARGIECFAVTRAHNLVAYAEKVSVCVLLAQRYKVTVHSSSNNHHVKQGLAPQLHIHSTTDLSLLQKISWGTQAGYVAIAFSGDGKRLAAIEQEQNSRLVVWDWQEVQDTQPPACYFLTHFP